jgi:hypothetical protein
VAVDEDRGALVVGGDAQRQAQPPPQDHVLLEIGVGLEIGEREVSRAAVVDFQELRPDAGAQLAEAAALHGEADAVDEEPAVVQVGVVGFAFQEDDGAVGEGLVRLVPEIGERRLALGVDLQPLGGERPHGRVVGDAGNARAEPRLNLVGCHRSARSNPAPQQAQIGRDDNRSGAQGSRPASCRGGAEARSLIPRLDA